MKSQNKQKMKKISVIGIWKKLLKAKWLDDLKITQLQKDCRDVNDDVDNV